MSLTVRRQHDHGWETPEPPSFDCLLDHLKTAADGLTKLTALYRQLHDEIKEQLAKDRCLTPKQLNAVRRLTAWIDTEDFKNIDDRTLRPLANVAGANNNLYFDVLRLSGEISWDDVEKNWSDTIDLVQREAMRRYGGRSSSDDEGQS